jgi:lipid II:glycine glycyltransferase (peptidoglycan interpeptide bridge formation enzyme)
MSDHKHTHTAVSFLQSAAWAEFQTETLGKKTVRIDAGDLSGIAIRAPVGCGNYYAYVPHGPSGNYTAASLAAFVRNIREYPELRRSFFLRVEPFFGFSKPLSDTLKNAGFRKVTNVQPEETIVLNLLEKEDILLKQMEHNTRYSIRAATRRGVSVAAFSAPDAVSKDAFREFWEMFLETNTRHRLRFYPEAYYRGVCALNGDSFSKTYIAYHEHTAIAAAIVVFFRGRATYLFASSRSGFGNLNAPTLLLWSAILDAKNMGYASFDFWGASDTKKEWAGVTAVPPCGIWARGIMCIISRNTSRIPCSKK